MKKDKYHLNYSASSKETKWKALYSFGGISLKVEIVHFWMEKGLFLCSLSTYRELYCSTGRSELEWNLYQKRKQISDLLQVVFGPEEIVPGRFVRNNSDLIAREENGEWQIMCFNGSGYLHPVNRAVENLKGMHFSIIGTPDLITKRRCFLVSHLVWCNTCEKLV